MMKNIKGVLERCMYSNGSEDRMVLNVFHRKTIVNDGISRMKFYLEGKNVTSRFLKKDLFERK